MTGRPNATTVAQFLKILYGAGGMPGVLVTFTLPSGSTAAFECADDLGRAPGAIAHAAERENVYVGICPLRASPEAGKRGSADDAAAVPGVWFDLDVRGPGHKSDALPTSRLEALDFIADDIGVEPSLVVDSGGGLQVYWLFHEPARCNDAAVRKSLAQLSEDWQRHVIALGERRAWTLDNTSDLARIFRPAGTLNHKSTPPRPVRVLWQSRARYRADELRALTPVAARFPEAMDVSSPAPGVDMRTEMGRQKGLGRSPAEIAESIDRRIRAYMAKLGNRSEGSRDNAAFQFAAWLLNDMAASDAVTWAYLTEWDAGNQPPLGQRELRRKMQSATRSADRPYGCALERGRVP